MNYCENLDSVKITIIKRSIPWDSTNSVTSSKMSQFEISFKDKESEIIYLLVSSPDYKNLKIPIFNDENEIEIDIFLARIQSSNNSYATFKDSDSRNSKFSSLYFRVLFRNLCSF